MHKIEEHFCFRSAMEWNIVFLSKEGKDHKMRIDLDVEASGIPQSYYNMMKEELSQKKYVETEDGFEGHCDAIYSLRT